MRFGVRTFSGILMVFSVQESWATWSWDPTPPIATMVSPNMASCEIPDRTKLWRFFGGNSSIIWGFSMIFPAMTGRNCPKYPIRAAVNRGHPEIVFRSQSPAGSPKYSILCAFDLEGLVGGRHQRYFYYRKTWNYRSVFITSIVFHCCSVIFQSVQPDFGLPKLELAVFQDFPSSHGLVETGKVGAGHDTLCTATTRLPSFNGHFSYLNWSYCTI